MAFSVLDTSRSGFRSQNDSNSISAGSYKLEANQLVIVGVRWEGGGTDDTATATVTDTAGNIYVNIGYKTTGGGESQKVGLYYSRATTPAEINITTATISTTRSYRSIGVMVFNNSDVPVLDQTGSGQNATNQTAWTSTPNLTSDTAGLVVAQVGWYNGTSFLTTDWDVLTSASANTSYQRLGYHIPTGAYDDAPGGTSTNADTYAMVTAAFAVTSNQYMQASAGSILTEFSSIKFGRQDNHFNNSFSSAFKGSAKSAPEIEVLSIFNSLASGPVDGFSRITPTGQVFSIDYPPPSVSLIAGAGVFSIAGTPASLISSYKININAGVFSIQGADASLIFTKGFTLNADAGVYSIIGIDAVLTPSGSSPILTADAGAFAFTGSPATLARSYTLALDAGAYTITGAPVTFTYTKVYSIAAEAGYCDWRGNTLRSAGIAQGISVDVFDDPIPPQTESQWRNNSGGWSLYLDDGEWFSDGVKSSVSDVPMPPEALALVDGFVSDRNDPFGWNNYINPQWKVDLNFTIYRLGGGLSVCHFDWVGRDPDYVANYDPLGNETITLTVPALALNNEFGGPIVSPWKITIIAEINDPGAYSITGSEATLTKAGEVIIYSIVSAEQTINRTASATQTINQSINYTGALS